MNGFGIVASLFEVIDRHPATHCESDEFLLSIMSLTNRKSSRTTVTMRDVAQLANVSQSTVSRVLNDSDNPIPIGEATRQRVLSAVEELGYHPNLHAGSLRGSKTYMIAVMIADITNPFYHPIVRAIQDAAYEHRSDVIIANSDHAIEGEKHFMESVIRRPVDGIVIVPYHLTDDDIQELIDRTGVMVAAIGQHVSHPQVDVAFSDDEKATRDAVGWLHKTRGHTRIGFVGVAGPNQASVRRRHAYEEAMQRAGLELPSGYVQLGDWSSDSGYRAMQQLLDLPTPPTAVFASNDLMAIGVGQAVQQHGLRVPDDVAIVGFDDIPAASWVRPRLTTIAQSPGDMGAHLAKALFERIEGEYDGPSRRIEVPLHFIVRESA